LVESAFATVAGTDGSKKTEDPKKETERERKRERRGGGRIEEKTLSIQMRRSFLVVRIAMARPFVMTFRCITRVRET